MNWMENLLIIAGVSLDIFAAMECQGSLVAKINKKSDSDLWNRCAGTADYVISGAFLSSCSAITGRCRTKNCWDRLYPW